MAHRRTMGAVILDESFSAMGAGSPLRRRSLAAPLTPRVQEREIIPNDDESEILARRRQPTPLNTSKTPDTTERRISLGSVMGVSTNTLMEHINKCLQLCAENKINAKNAFALSMIDYMGPLCKRDQNSNMQNAGTSLDVSTKIYSVRVDCVYLDALRMVKDSNKTKEQGEAESQDADSSHAEAPKAEPKKKRSGQPTRGTEETLDEPIENANLLVETDNSDSQTTDTLNMITFPVHTINGYGLQLYEDVIPDVKEDKDNDGEHIEAEYEIDEVKDLGESKIGRILTNFNMVEWSETDQPETLSEANGLPSGVRNGNSENEMVFDLDASVVNECDDDNTGFNYFDLDEASQENVDRCGRMGGEEAERIVDFRESVAEREKEQNNVEYSFAQRTVLQFHWAGPVHSKRKSVPKIVNGSRVVGACRQESARKKKEVNLDYNRDFAQDFFYKLGSKIPRKLQSKTLRLAWQEEKLTLPEDVHYDSSNPTKLYFQSTRMKPLIEKPITAAEITENGDAPLDQASEDYDYNNLNDTQDYCSQNNGAGDMEGDDNAMGLENGHGDDNQDENQANGNAFDDLCTQGLTGENLVALPRATTQTQIAYSVRAKKIDMRHLKKSLWKALLTIKNGIEAEENTGGHGDTNVSHIKEEKNFSDVYKELPDLLGKNNTEALSPALAFASLLHLANEKNLNITSTPDMSDMKITQG